MSEKFNLDFVQVSDRMSCDSTNKFVKYHFDEYLEKIHLETSNVQAQKPKEDSIAKEWPILS